MAQLPARVAGRVLYQLHSLGAAGAPAANPDVDARVPSGHGLRRLAGWLDHVAALGCGGVLLTPVFVSCTHGYDTVDPFRIDQRLGDDDDFRAFVDQCHARDLDVILDGVFNHVGRDFAPFRDVLAHGPGSEYADWFRLDFSRDDGDGFGYRTFEGHHGLVALNHHNDAVLDWAVAVARHWLALGADGWRLDAAYAIPSPFLASLTSAVRQRHPEAFLFGEVIHGDYAGFVRDSGLDAVTQYELYKAIWSSLNDANFFELAWALKRHHTFTTAFAPVTFVGNHDVTRIASVLHEPDHLGHALAILFTVPGVPCVYYGDELGWRGRKEHRTGGDDAIRPALPPAPVTSTADADAASAFRLHEQLVALRRDRPWLTAADVEVVETATHRITFTVTSTVTSTVSSTGPDGDALLVTLDVDASTVAAPVGWNPILAERGWTICERA